MERVVKILTLCLILFGFACNVSGQKRASLTPVPAVVPKRVILKDEFIKVNSRDTIFVQTIQLPLMSDEQKIFVLKRISDYRSSKIKQFIDSYYNRDKVRNEYYQDMNYLQKWNFEIVFQSDTELSLKLLNYEFTGGAHGSTSVKSFNLDLKGLKSYKFNEKFINLDVEKVAQYCTNYCKTKDIPIFDDYVKATPDLFNVWNFTNEGLLLTFPQYSIAPYSSGIIEIHIPKKELEELTIKN